MSSKKTVLVIVESPSKIKKIKSILEGLLDFKDKYNFIVKASYGHICDLDSKKLSIDIENNFEPTYKVSESKTHVVSELRRAKKNSDCVWIASDYDREGESIAWHIHKSLKLNDQNSKRIIFTAITKEALKNAVENMTKINIDMFKAQQARRVIDRLIGYLISPVLWKQIQSSNKKDISLSAGRIQSVVSKLIIDRENEIKKHNTMSSFKTNGVFKKENKKINSELNKQFNNKNDVKLFLQECISSKFIVDEVTKKKSTRKPSAPFITSTLQQEASNRLKFSPKKTMSVAQSLYDNAYITYMRTDCYTLSDEAIELGKAKIIELFGEKYYNKIRKTNTKSKNSQEAHEAIRPTNFDLLDLSDDESMDEQQNKLYKLIYKRTMASLMTNASVEIITTKIKLFENEKIDYCFVSKNEKILFDGFLKIYKPLNLDSDGNVIEETNENNEIISVKKGDILVRENIISKEKYSKPKHSRYTEASLVKKLDDSGLGRPSTYSSMISIVQDRNYAVKKDKDGEEKKIRTYVLNGSNEIEKKSENVKVNNEKQKLFPTEIGIIVNDFLNKHFSNIIDYQFTIKMEEYLDKINNGELIWHHCVKKIFDMFYPKVKELNGSMHLEKDDYRRSLGIDPKTNREIVTYIGKYGPLVQMVNPDSDGKQKYAPLKDINIREVTIQQALKLLKYPYNLCLLKNKDVKICIGKYGVYIKYDNKNYSLGELKEEELDEEKVKEIIFKPTENVKSNIIKKINDNIIIKNGKYGPYISYKNKLNVKIYGKKKPEDLTENDCNLMINNKKKNKSK